MSNCPVDGGSRATLLDVTDSRLRCIVVDDHPAIRAGVRSMLTASPDIQVVGEAGSGEAALEMVGKRCPDVVVMDLQMGRGTDGFGATEAICERHPDAAVVLLTGFDEQGFAARALECGARGYVLKNAPPEDVARAVRAAAAGDVYVDPTVAMQLIPGGPRDRGELTAREREVLSLLQEGLRSSEIAGRLYISRATVRSHVRNAMDKLGASTFTQAVANAIRLRLIT